MPNVINLPGGSSYTLDKQGLTNKLKVEIDLFTEAVAMEVWSEAKKHHVYENQSGALERSTRVEKGPVSKNEVEYRVLMGVGGSSFSKYAGRAGGSRAKPGDNPYYALYVELGTRRMPPYPALRPALLAVTKKAKAFYRSKWGTR